MSDLRAAWSRLGFRFTEAPAADPVDLEVTLVATLLRAREDSRLFWGVATWLHRYGALVDGRRLGARLDAITGGESTSAILAALVTASKSPQLKGLLPRCAPLPAPEPLFHVRRGNPAALLDLGERALSSYRQWGILLADEILKLDALRPTSWVLRMNPGLLVRAILGADLRAEVLSTMLDSRGGLTATELARLVRRTYASVHAACASLVSAGFLAREPAGRSVCFHVPEDVREWIAAYPPGLAPAARKASAA